jgi:hypothetical protein
VFPYNDQEELNRSPTRKEATMAKGPKASALIPIRARSITKERKLTNGKIEKTQELRKFLWDSPELRKAFRAAKEREEARRGKRR